MPHRGVGGGGSTGGVAVEGVRAERGDKARRAPSSMFMGGGGHASND